MNLPAAESQFVEQREKLVRYWPFAGGGIMFLLAALVVWLWGQAPFLVNPWAVSAGLENGTLPQSTMVLMTAMLPIVMLAFIVFVAATVFLAFVAVANERRLIKLIRRLNIRKSDNETAG